MPEALWVFGYGSLIWRVDFEYERAEPAYIMGWQRRFWQGSTDHRGLPGKPGRVVTLIEAPGEICWGMAYRLKPETQDTVMRHLDHRERGGYGRIDTQLHLKSSTPLQDPVKNPVQNPVPGITYHATEDNQNYLGPADDTTIAQQIIDSEGPSGPNIEYLLQLESALKHLSVTDEHISALAHAARLRMAATDT